MNINFTNPYTFFLHSFPINRFIFSLEITQRRDGGFTLHNPETSSQGVKESEGKKQKYSKSYLKLLSFLKDLLQNCHCPFWASVLNQTH